MGLVFSRLFSSLFGNKEARILVLGLDNAGKTTILYRLQMGEVVSTIPTIGFNVETVQYNNIKFQVWDLGGQTSIRPYWRCYFPNTQAIIYVVDSSDTDRLVVANEEFHAILEEEELKGAVVLIYANKQDLPGALDDAAVTEALELHKIKNRQWAIFKTSAIKGEGLFEGLDWALRCTTSCVHVGSWEGSHPKGMKCRQPTMIQGSVVIPQLEPVNYRLHGVNFTIAPKLPFNWVVFFGKDKQK
ncbi:hypothetical protein KY290_030665 [Solanum tuberosum]|uniref:ADP-ribosylation factor n=1 Tax=Solanum tuberosum TaxID=4113 RepID=A0ABQ7U6X0_SOLTU|nr:hypothetical protein KY290_030665 [Solanum tuberosum]